MSLIKTGKLTQRELKKLIQDVEQYRDKATAAGIYDSKDGVGTNTSVRNCLTYFPNAVEYPNTYNILQSTIIQQCSDLEFDFTDISEIQYVCYNEGDFFNWHGDVLNVKTNPVVRVFTFTINISDPNQYDGGELLLKHNNEIYQLPKEAGSFVIFPSFLKHQASIVTRGKREAIVVWTRMDRECLKRAEDLYNNELSNA